MRNKYRIVTDDFAGFEVQIKRWWFPFWIQCTMGDGFCNTHLSIESAKAYIIELKQGKPKREVVYSE